MRGVRGERGERVKREIGEWVEEESEGSIPTSFQKRLGCESEKFGKSDLVRFIISTVLVFYNTSSTRYEVSLKLTFGEKSELLHYDFFSDTTPAVRSTILP